MNPRSICRFTPPSVSPCVRNTARNSVSFGMPRSFLNSFRRLSASLAASARNFVRPAVCLCAVRAAIISSIDQLPLDDLAQLLAKDLFLADRTLRLAQADQLADPLVDSLADFALVDRVIADAGDDAHLRVAVDTRDGKRRRRRRRCGRDRPRAARGCYRRDRRQVVGKANVSRGRGFLIRRGCSRRRSGGRRRAETDGREDLRILRTSNQDRPRRFALQFLALRVRQSILRFSSRACGLAGPVAHPDTLAASHTATMRIPADARTRAIPVPPRVRIKQRAAYNRGWEERKSKEDQR